MRRRIALTAAAAGLLVVVYVAGVLTPSAWATYAESWQLAIQQGFNTQGTAGASTDTVIGIGYWDGSSWQRVTGGLISGGAGYTSDNFGQQAISASAAVPTTALTGRVKLSVFNQDTATNIFCKDGATATTANGVMIEPRTGRNFPTTGTVQCISASGTVNVDLEEYAPQ